MAPDWWFEQMEQNQRDGRSCDPEQVTRDYVERMADKADESRQRRKDEGR